MRFWPLALALGLTACSGSVTPEAPVAPGAPEGESTEGAAEGEATLTMQGIKLYLYDASPAVGVEQKPAFEVSADVFRQVEEKVWTFENAHAVVNPEGPEEDAFVFDAAAGELREEESAYLKGGVTGSVGTMQLSFEDLVWQNGTVDQPSLARSDNPVSIKDPAMELEASSIRLYPDSKRLELRDVSGFLTFGGNPS
jgi:hypothetical protein